MERHEKKKSVLTFTQSKRKVWVCWRTQNLSPYDHRYPPFILVIATSFCLNFLPPLDTCLSCPVVSILLYTCLLSTALYFTQFPSLLINSSGSRILSSVIKMQCRDVIAAQNQGYLWGSTEKSVGILFDIHNMQHVASFSDVDNFKC